MPRHAGAGAGAAASHCSKPLPPLMQRPSAPSSAAAPVSPYRCPNLRHHYIGFGPDGPPPSPASSTHGSNSGPGFHRAGIASAFGGSVSALGLHGRAYSSPGHLRYLSSTAAAADRPPQAMAFSPPPDVMAVDETPPKPDSSPASHGGGGADARHWSAEVEQMKSSLHRHHILLDQCGKYGLSLEKYRPFCPEDGWGPCKTPPEGSICIFMSMLEIGVRLPMDDFYSNILWHYNIAPSQLTSNSWRFLLGFMLLCDEAGIKPTLSIFRWYFKLCPRPVWVERKSKLQGWYCFVPYSRDRKLFSSQKQIKNNGWNKLYFFLESLSPETAWRCPTKWGTPSKKSHNDPVLDNAAKEAIVKLETHGDKNSLESLLFKHNKLPFLPILDLSKVNEADNGRPISPPRKCRVIICDPRPQRPALALSYSPPPKLLTPVRFVRVDNRDCASQMLMDALQEERSQRAADVAHLKAKHEAEMKALKDEWQLKVKDAFMGVALKETFSAGERAGQLQRGRTPTSVSAPTGTSRAAAGPSTAAG